MVRSDDTTTRDIELTSTPNAPQRRWGLLGLYVAVIAIVLAGTWGLVTRDDPTAEPPETTDATVAPSSTEQRSAQELLEVMPASPIDGKESQRLPVLATTQSELVDGQVVTVLGKGFAPNERAGAVMCAAEAALHGVTACELGRNGTFDLVAYTNASAEGFVRVDVVVRALIETPFTGPLDCLSGPERCIVAIGAVGDYDRSGGTAIGFAGQPAFAEPSLSVSGQAPYEPGRCRHHGLGPAVAAEVAIRLCAREQAEQCATAAQGRVAADGTFAASVALPPSFVVADGTVVSCEGGCQLRLDYLGLDGTTEAPEPQPQPVTFAPVEAPIEGPPESIMPMPMELTTMPPSTVPVTTAPSTVPLTTMLD